MKIKSIVCKTIALMMMNSLVYAANVVTSSQGSNGSFNPYAAFNANAAATETNDSNLTTEPANSVTAQAGQAQVGNSAPMAAPVAAKAPVPAANSIQYVQPASQVGKPAAPPPKVNFNQSYRVPSGNKGAQTNQNYGGVSSGSPNTVNNGNNAYVPGFVPPSPGSPPIPAPSPISNSLLQQILANTSSINTATQSIQGLDQQLGSYWMTPPTAQDYQNLQTISGYSALSNLNNAFASAAIMQQNMTASNGFVSLAGNWSAGNPSGPSTLVPSGSTNNQIKNLNSSFPYLNNLTQGSVANPETDSLWIPAVNTALYNLSANQTSITAIGQAVNAPFGGQSDWATTIQSASTPQLLRALVIEQAVQNEIAYQILLRQQDQEVMQASELAMLAAIHNDFKNASSEQIRQQTRIVQAIYNLNNK